MSRGAPARRIRACASFLAGFLASLLAQAADPFAEGVRTTDPLSPGDQQQTFQLPPGFEIQLVASEPDINKPMNMAFDALGRLWVTTSIEYPWPAPADRPARDRLMIFEDFGPDGRARKVTEFAGGLNIPIGVYPFRSPRGAVPGRPPAGPPPGDDPTWKAVVWSIPHIWLMEDVDGDGRADRRERLYGPFDHTRDTHGNQASFRRGFDGWLHATHGFNNDSHVSGLDGNEVHLNSGNTYRVRLDGSRIEHHTRGQVNPYGLAWDPAGNLYSSDCHSAPIYQLLAGGSYPSFGKPHDGLGFAPVLMEHSHGSTAIDGMLYYADDLWPDEFAQNVFVGNVMTSRVNRDRLTFIGSTPRADELDDFVKSRDPWFRPVDNQLGPDGAFYIADFYNRIIGHYEVPLTHPGRDRERGRIWRVIYTGAQPALRDRAFKDGLEGVVEELASPNLTRRMLAMNEIQDRFGTAAIEPVRAFLRKAQAAPPASGAAAQVHALWLLERLGALDEATLGQAARHDSALVRTHALRILAGRGQAPLGPSRPGTPEPDQLASGLRNLAFAALQDPDALVQRCASEALGAWPVTANLRPLLDLLGRVPAADTHLLYVVRKSIRDHLNRDEIFSEVINGRWSASDLAAFTDVAIAVNSSQSGAFLLQRLEAAPPDRETAAAWLRHAARYAPAASLDALAAYTRDQLSRSKGDLQELDRQFALFKSVDDGLQQRGTPMPDSVRNWASELASTFLASLENSPSWTAVAAESSSGANPWDLEQRPCTDGVTRNLTSSLPRGEQLTGVLRSPIFEAPANLSFWLCGHNGFPDQPDHRKNRIRLIAADNAPGAVPEVLAEAFPPRSDTARKVSWDLERVRGRNVCLEVTDGDTGTAFAWLAFGGFEPGLPELKTSKLPPSRMTECAVASADIASRFQLAGFIPFFARQAALEGSGKTSAGDPEEWIAFARAWAALDPANASPGLTRTLASPACPPAYREPLGVLLAAQAAPESREAVIAALPAAPTRVQNRWTQSLTGTAAGSDALLAAIEDGRLSPRLLQGAGIRDRIKAAGIADWETRFSRLTANLPPADSQLEKLVAGRKSAFMAASASPADGRRVFEQNCAACHRVEGAGALVGPQLDGIGNRGLERVLEDILDPNRNVDRAFRSQTLVLKDGDILSGLPRREEGDLLILADSTGKEFSVPKSAIQEQHDSETSLMPENFGDLIPSADFNALVAFLLAQRGPVAESAAGH